MALRLGLHVEVPGSAIDEEEAREETARVILVDPGVLYVFAAGYEGSGVRDVLIGLYGPRLGGWGCVQSSFEWKGCGELLVV